jgi:hypothetical protein
MTNLSHPEPPPQPTAGQAIWSLVLRDMLDRHEAGVAKYGTPLTADNGRDALVDAYQEALDLCVYLRQEIERRKAVLLSLTTDQAAQIGSRLPANFYQLPPAALGNLVKGVTG